MRIWIPRLVMSLSVGLAVAACAGANAASSDSIVLLEAAPHPGSPLVAGRQVEIAVTAKYNLQTADSGTVVLVVQNEQHSPVVVKDQDQAQKDVPRGMGEVTLTSVVPVKAQFKSVEVYIALISGNKKSTNVTTHFEYPVQQP